MCVCVFACVVVYVFACVHVCCMCVCMCVCKCACRAPCSSGSSVQARLFLCGALPLACMTRAPEQKHNLHTHTGYKMYITSHRPPLSSKIVCSSQHCFTVCAKHTRVDTRCQLRQGGHTSASHFRVEYVCGSPQSYHLCTSTVRFTHTSTLLILHYTFYTSTVRFTLHILRYTSYTAHFTLQPCVSQNGDTTIRFWERQARVRSHKLRHVFHERASCHHQKQQRDGEQRAARKLGGGGSVCIYMSIN